MNAFFIVILGIIAALTLAFLVAIVMALNTRY